MAGTGRRTPGDAAAVARFDELAAAAPGCVSVERSALRPLATWSPPLPAPAELSAAAFARALDRRWRRTSYSDITSGAHEARVASEPEEDVLADEPATAETRRGRRPRRPRAAGDAPLPLADLPAGVRVGTFVHRVLETADFAAPDLAAELAAAVAAEAARRPLDVGDRAALAAGLRAALETPLGPAAGGIRLRDVARADRLDELAFELPLAGGDEPTRARPARRAGGGAAAPRRARRSAGRVRASGSRTRRSARTCAASSPAASTSWCGSPGTGCRASPWWTTRRTGSRRRARPLQAWHYRPAALVEEMERRHYPLQALLYAVALHRYLRWRLPGYEPGRNLAGVLYLFLRGMTGAPGSGVVAWRPPGRSSRRSATRWTGARRRERARPIPSTPAGRAPPAALLRAFNDAGVLAAADVHVARRLAELAGEDDEQVALAAALAVRGPRLGHVRVDLASIRETATAEGEEAVDVAALPWPAPRRVAGAAGGERAGGGRGGGGRRRAAAAAAAGRHGALPRPLLARGAAARGRPARAGRGRAAGRRDRRPRRRARPALPRADGRAPVPRGGRRRAPAVRGRGRRARDGQDDDRRAHRRAAGRAGHGAAARGAGRADGQGGGAAGGGRPRGGGRARGGRGRPRRAARAARLDAAPPARGAAGAAQPAPPREPPPARRGGRGRDLDGLAPLHGAAGRGRAPRRPARARRRSRPARLDRGRRRPGRHRRADDGRPAHDAGGPRPPPGGDRPRRARAGPAGRRHGGRRDRRPRPRPPLRRRHRAGGRGDPRAATATRPSRRSAPPPARSRGSRSTPARREAQPALAPVRAGVVAAARAVLAAARRGEAHAGDPGARRPPRAVRAPRGPVRRAAPGRRGSRRGSPRRSTASGRAASGTSAARCS